MSFKFPENPVDGEQIIMPLGNGYGHVYQYDSSNNAWVIVDYTGVGVPPNIEIGEVTTENVLTVPLNPFTTPIVVDTIDDIVNLENQREVNWVIAELALEAKNSQIVQDERIQAVELATQDLYSITDNHNARINVNSLAIADNKLDIIELEEELEALAPSLERGEWEFSSTMGAGKFLLFDDAGQPTSNYNNVSSIFISVTDADGGPHGFGNVPSESFVEVFDATDDDYGLYQIKDVDDKSNMVPGYWVFTVDFIKSNALISGPDGRSRFKFFELADAADPTSFVAKSGDSMQGDLTMESSNIIFKPIVPDGDPDGSRPERWNYITSKRVRDANGDLVTGAASDFGIRVDLTEGRTGYNKFEYFSNVDGGPSSSFISLNGGNNPGIKFLRGSFNSSIDLKLNTDAQTNGTNIVFTGSKQSGLFVNNTSKLIFDDNKTYAYGRYDFQTADASDVYFQVYADDNEDSKCHVRYYGSTQQDYDIINKKFINDGFTVNNGPLVLYNTQPDTGFKVSVSDVDALVTFRTANENDASDTLSANLWQPGKKNALMTNADLYSKGVVYSNTIRGWDTSTGYTHPGKIVATSSNFTSYWGNNSRININTNGGNLQYAAKNQLSWSNGGALKYDGVDRVLWNEGGGQLKGPSNMALGWNDDGVVTLRAGNSTGSAGQVLTRASNGYQWATPTAPTPTIGPEQNGVFADMLNRSTSNSSLSGGYFTPLNGTSYSSEVGRMTRMRIYTINGISLGSYRGTRGGTITVSRDSNFYYHGCIYYLEDAGNSDTYIYINKLDAKATASWGSGAYKITITGLIKY